MFANSPVASRCRTSGSRSDWTSAKPFICQSPRRRRGCLNRRHLLCGFAVRSGSAGCELADEFLEWLRRGGVFLDVDAGFFAQDEAEQCLEDAAVAVRFTGFGARAVADEEAARDERLNALREAIGEDVESVETR